MIPFSPPRIDQRTLDEVSEALRSGWITTGPRTKKFEAQLRDYTGGSAVLCTASATAGLELILRWFGVGPGDEVILPAYTYCATANVVEHCGATPILVDIQSDFNIDPKAVAANITERTKIIMPVDIGGMPCDYNAMNALVREPEVQAKFQAVGEEQAKLGRILVLSDAAHSFGASYHNQQSGSLCDVSVFSFHAVKNLTTAEGGAIVFCLPEPFDNEALYAHFNILSLHGQNKDARAKMQKGNWKYDVVAAGYKCNMTDLQAAIGLVELARYESETLPKRKHIFAIYDQILRTHEWAVLPEHQTTEKSSSYHLYMLRVNGITEAQRDAIITEIFERDVSVNVHFQPLPLLTYYRNQGFNMNDYPKAYEAFSKEITLPVYYDLSDEDARTVAQAVVEAVESVLYKAADA